MEQNALLATVLRSIGYEVRNAGGRVSRGMSPYPEVRQNQRTTYDGWNHMLNLVYIGGEWYVVDVGMGSMGPNMVMPLRDGFETVSVAPRLIRLQRRPIAESYAFAPAGEGRPGPPLCKECQSIAVLYLCLRTHLVRSVGRDTLPKRHTLIP